jgi:hypothetical protein
MDSSAVDSSGAILRALICFDTDEDNGILADYFLKSGMNIAEANRTADFAAHLIRARRLYTLWRTFWAWIPKTPARVIQMFCAIDSMVAPRMIIDAVSADITALEGFAHCDMRSAGARTIATVRKICPVEVEVACDMFVSGTKIARGKYEPIIFAMKMMGMMGAPVLLAESVAMQSRSPAIVHFALDMIRVNTKVPEYVVGTYENSSSIASALAIDPEPQKEEYVAPRRTWRDVAAVVCEAIGIAPSAANGDVRMLDESPAIDVPATCTRRATAQKNGGARHCAHATAAQSTNGCARDVAQCSRSETHKEQRACGGEGVNAKRRRVAQCPDEEYVPDMWGCC